MEKHEQMKEEYDVAIKEYYESHPDALKEKEGKNTTNPRGTASYSTDRYFVSSARRAGFPREA